MSRRPSRSTPSRSTPPDATIDWLDELIGPDQAQRSHLTAIARFAGTVFNRLEFLGDTVLEQVLLEPMLRFDGATAGSTQDELTACTSDSALGATASRLGIDRRLPDDVPASRAADAIEALAGACFVYQGWPGVERFAEIAGIAGVSGRDRPLLPYLEPPGPATEAAIEAALGVRLADPRWASHALFDDDRQALLGMAGSHVFEVAAVHHVYLAEPDHNSYELSQTLGRLRRRDDVLRRIDDSPLGPIIADTPDRYDAARALLGAVLVDSGRITALRAAGLFLPKP